MDASTLLDTIRSDAINKNIATAPTLSKGARRRQNQKMNMRNQLLEEIAESIDTKSPNPNDAINSIMSSFIKSNNSTIQPTHSITQLVPSVTQPIPNVSHSVPTVTQPIPNVSHSVPTITQPIPNVTRPIPGIPYPNTNQIHPIHNITYPILNMNQSYSSSKKSNKKKFKPKNLIPNNIRHAVWYAFIGNKMHDMCFCCNTVPISIDLFQVGHILARSKGGPNHINNLRPICQFCNKDMGAIHMLEYMEFYGLRIREDFYNEFYPHPSQSIVDVNQDSISKYPTFDVKQDFISEYADILPTFNFDEWDD